MLLVAYNWDDTPRFTLDEVLALPEAAHYVAGWPRNGDFGLIAERDGIPLGAVWARTLPADDPGYGFVAQEIPELSLGVERAERGHGIGRTLLSALIERAADGGVPALSLSVEDGNRARRLYERAGFEVVGRNGNSDTMLLRLN